MSAKQYEVLDPALEIIAAYGPDLRNGLTNHAPMAIEALCAMGRGDAAMRWLEHYRKGMAPRPAPRERIETGRDQWRSAAGRIERVADWSALFENELKEAPWPEVLDRWVGRFAPGISASATHGVIRVGHAARGLSQAESPERLKELADGLAYWAATYEELPTDLSAPSNLRPRQAILRVASVPQEKRKYSGTITGSLRDLDRFPDFAPVIALVGIEGEGDPSSLISELTETFARVYLANAHDVLTAIVFIHGVTSAASLRLMLPHLHDRTARAGARYAWQAGCALYAAFGARPAPSGEIEPPRESRERLVEMAVENQDEHAIKFTEACIREDALSPSPAYLAAARHALGILRPD